MGAPIRHLARLPNDRRAPLRGRALRPVAPALLASALALSGCMNPDLERGLDDGGRKDAAVQSEAQRIDYRGIETRMMDDSLVEFTVRAQGGGRDAVAAYADCAAAQYALIRGYGFARHLRTNIAEEGGVWRGDAVYTISSELPQGLRTLEAQTVADDCAEQGIPTV